MDAGGDMSEGILLWSEAEGVLTLTLNRPEKRNALNAPLVTALRDALRRAAADPAVRVVVLRGAGKDFCAGADLADMERIADLTEAENLADARGLGQLFADMRALPQPIVAVVRGRALAGGCGLATACDLVLAGSDAELGYPEVHLGFVPAMVMAILRRKVTEGKAFDLVARGQRIPAEEARDMGLVNHVFPEATLEDDVARFVADLAARPATALALIKSLLYELGDLDFSDGVERGARVNVEARMTEACRDGVRRFLDRNR